MTVPQTLLLLLTSIMSTTISVIDALSESIVVVGLNAALQKRFILPPSQTIIPGNVHRAYKCETGVGGKGQDVGVALSCFNKFEPTSKEDKVLVAQFLGKGAEGDVVSHALQRDFGLCDALTVRTAAPLRTCTTIVGADCATELVEMSGPITQDEMGALMEKIERLTTKDGKASCVCIMGSLPPGCHENTYADLSLRLVGEKTLVLIDSVVGLESLLNVLKSIFDTDYPDKCGGALLKLNVREFCNLSGIPKSETDRVTMDELTTLTNRFVVKYPNSIGALDYLCITDGKFPGYVVEIPKTPCSSTDVSFRTWQVPVVDLSKQATADMLFPIGAGDTVSAGTLAAWQYLQHTRITAEFSGVIPSSVGKILSNKKVEWCDDVPTQDEKGYEISAAFAFGLACGSASCLQKENSVFNVEDAITFFSGMTRPSLHQ